MSVTWTVTKTIVLRGGIPSSVAVNVILYDDIFSKSNCLVVSKMVPFTRTNGPFEFKLKTTKERLRLISLSGSRQVTTPTRVNGGKFSGILELLKATSVGDSLISRTRIVNALSTYN